ncbi:MAG: SRPBCC family protein [Acidimicrobiales bacterium]|jgi:uncharacterized protein YndB with AHSA1/START domain
MAKREVSAERTIQAPAHTVFGYLADMREHHPRFLPPAFSELEIVAGGLGAGTIVHFKLTAGGRTREYRMNVAEPEPGRVLTESDMNSSLVTTFTVVGEGAHCLVRISTSWNGAGGVGGFFEGLFAPRVLRRIYLDELERLNSYALSQASSGATG